MIRQRTIPNAFLAWIAPDGEAIAYGHKRVVIEETLTGRTIWERPAAEWAPCGWLDSTLLGVSTSVVGGCQLSILVPYERHLRAASYVRPETWPGVQGSRAVAGGHTFAAAPDGATWRRYVDDIDVTGEPGTAPLIVSPDGSHYLFVRPDLGCTVNRTRDHQTVMLAAPGLWYRLDTVDGVPYVSLNSAGRTEVWSPLGLVHLGRDGEARGAVCGDGLGGVEVWTQTWETGQSVMLGRVLGDPHGPARVVTGQYVPGFDLVYTKAGLVMTGHDQSDGDCIVSLVPHDVPHQAWPPAIVTPPPVIVTPEPPAPPAPEPPAPPSNPVEPPPMVTPTPTPEPAQPRPSSAPSAVRAAVLRRILGWLFSRGGR